MQQTKGLPETMIVFCVSPPIGKSPQNARGRSRCATGHILVRKPVTKLARRCAGVGYLWLGYPGRSSGPGQPDSPPQPPELPCGRWAAGTRKRSPGLPERGQALTEVSATMSDLATGGRSPSQYSCGLAALSRALLSLPMTPGN